MGDGITKTWSVSDWRTTALTTPEGSGIVTVALFTTPTCAPCKPVKAALQRYADAGYFRLYVLNAESETALVNHYQIGGSPTVAIFRDGQMVDLVAGSQAQKVDGLLKRILAL
jgi:thioredoxin-like negative regulator of GroEL